MDQIPELKRESFVTKVAEARAAKVKDRDGNGRSTRSLIQSTNTIGQPCKLDTLVFRVIWDLGSNLYIRRASPAVR